VTKTAPKIFQWRNQVKDDRRLGAIDFMVAYQLSEQTNAAEFDKSGQLLTWQGIDSMAAAIGVSDRTVQRSIGRLKKYKQLAVTPAVGRHRSNRYTLLLKPVQAVAAVGDKVEMVTAVSPFPKNGDSRVTLSREKVTNLTRNGDNGGAEMVTAVSPESLRESFSNPSADCETADCGAEPRLGGARPAPLGRLEGEPHPHPHPMMGRLEAGLRRILGENFKWLVMAELVECSADVVMLSVMTAAERDNIRKHCEAAILEVSGASKLEFKIELAVEPPPLRRMP
jgi:hypothetical protein